MIVFSTAVVGVGIVAIFLLTLSRDDNRRVMFLDAFIKELTRYSRSRPQPMPEPSALVVRPEPVPEQSYCTGCGHLVPEDRMRWAWGRYLCTHCIREAE